MERGWKKILLIATAVLVTASASSLIVACSNHSARSTGSSSVDYTDPLFTAIVPKAWTSVSETLQTGGPNDPIRIVTFSIPTDPVPVLYVYIYPHGADVVADEPPGVLGTSGNFDIYYQIRTAPEDQSVLAPFDLSPAQFQIQLLNVVKSLKAN